MLRIIFIYIILFSYRITRLQDYKITRIINIKIIFYHISNLQIVNIKVSVSCKEIRNILKTSWKHWKHLAWAWNLRIWWYTLPYYHMFIFQKNVWNQHKSLWHCIGVNPHYYPQRKCWLSRSYCSTKSKLHVISVRSMCHARLLLCSQGFFFY